MGKQGIQRTVAQVMISKKSKDLKGIHAQQEYICPLLPDLKPYYPIFNGYYRVYGITKLLHIL